MQTHTFDLNWARVLSSIGQRRSHGPEGLVPLLVSAYMLPCKFDILIGLIDRKARGVCLRAFLLYNDGLGIRLTTPLQLTKGLI